MRRILLCIALLTSHFSLLTATAQGQADTLNHLSFGLQFLTHGETCGGGLPRSDGMPATEDRSSFLLGRTRLMLDYTHQGLEAYAMVQNNKVWGADGNQKLNLYEGWLKMTAKNGLFAQVGRVALAYDDERIIGPNDFAMAAASHDVLRLGYEGHGHQVHAILAYNQNDDDVYDGSYYIDGAQDYKTMQTVWYHYDVPKIPLGASLLFMNVGLQAGEYTEINNKKVVSEGNPPCTVNQQVYGGYLNFHPKRLTLEGSYYRQEGKSVDKAMGPNPIEAWMASVKATVSLTDNYGFEVGYDYLSGDDYMPVLYSGSFGMPRHEVIKGFMPLYGSHTKFYGIMDYYYESSYNNGFTPGLQNAFVGVSGSFWDKLNAKVTYHYLAVTTDLHNLDRTLGHSVELEARYKFSKEVSLSAGYTHMMGTETMDRLKQGSASKHARWGWFSLVFSPSKLTTKW